MSKKKGNFGETAAVKYLKNKGLKVLEQNYTSRYGEVDVIALAQGCLVFIEVKMRNRKSLAPGRAAVGKVKQKRIVKTALMYISKINSDVNIRFDVVEIKESECHSNESPEILHLENAFSSEDLYLEAA